MSSGEIRYVRANPTGNITCLVLSPAEGAERKRITASLMRCCEQVGYLEEPRGREAGIRLEMMGGEFCGNASMAAGAYLAARSGVREGQEAGMKLEVSGAKELISCRIRRLEKGWQGTVCMPGIPELDTFRLEGLEVVRVRMEGITHLITGRALDPREAERILRQGAEQLSVPAAGLLQWNAEQGFLRPLVYVPGSGTMVWESGCGSGSMAIGAWQAALRGEGETVTDVRQPGGTIRVRTDISGGRPVKTTISGTVYLEEETRLSI